VLACDLLATLRADGHDLQDRLDELARKHGLFVTGQLSVRVDDLALIQDAMARLRRRPPGTLLGEPVNEVTDLLPRTDGLRLRTSRVRVVIRPSGTEPKLKCYLQVTAPVDDETDLTPLRATTDDEMATLTTEIASAVGL
jgi:phosphomannomutase